VNERLITHLESAAGKVAVAKVGATCVGRIRTSYDDVVTNDRRTPYRRVRYEKAIPIAKGEECGVFEMGSTVIVFFQRGRVALDPAISPGAPVRVGQALAELVSS